MAGTSSQGRRLGDEGTLDGMFAFGGVIKPVTSLSDLGGVLATHPLFAQAWVQKLCAYANSAPCVTTDPEFLRVVMSFQAGGYSWSGLVSELMSSPLVTNDSPTATALANGNVLAVSADGRFVVEIDRKQQKEVWRKTTKGRPFWARPY